MAFLTEERQTFVTKLLVVRGGCPEAAAVEMRYADLDAAEPPFPRHSKLTELSTNNEDVWPHKRV